MSLRTDQKHKAAIIGGGVIGSGWAARFLLSGFDVALYDPDPEGARKVAEVMENARRSLPTLSDMKMPDEGTLYFASSIEEAVEGAEWIQESVPESLALKQETYATIQKAASKSAIIASSTSGFKPSELSHAAAVPDQIIVAHPFNPVYLLPLVELVGDEETVARAEMILTTVGMKPLIIEKEIDAHVADRLLEAVWRESLWLIHDGIATTGDIDDAIRYGFGLRWAQMGLFETYRIAGGEGGMAHFLRQFGPCLKWPWTKLMDVPDLTEELIQKIVSQSDEQSGHYTIRELERLRDDNLVAIMRALKGRDAATGTLLNHYDSTLKDQQKHDLSKPLISVNRVVPIDWTDYNGHMNEGRYGQVFSDAADTILELIGADQFYVEGGHSYFTVDTHTRYLKECHAGDAVHVVTHVLQAAGKKLELFHEMKDADGELAATCKQLLIHVSLETRRACPPLSYLEEKLVELVEAQVHLPKPALD